MAGQHRRATGTDRPGLVAYAAVPVVLVACLAAAVWPLPTIAVLTVVLLAVWGWRR